MLVRTAEPILDPRWVVSDVGLEDLVLAYMSAEPAADTRSTSRRCGHDVARVATVPQPSRVAAHRGGSRVHRPGRHPRPHRAVGDPDNLSTNYQSLRLLGTVLIGVPAVIGAFWGAPLLARELEARDPPTGVDAERDPRAAGWRRSSRSPCSRPSWSSACSSALFTWWSLPLDHFGNRIGTANFGQRGIAPVAYALFALEPRSAVRRDHPAHVARDGGDPRRVLRRQVHVPTVRSAASARATIATRPTTMYERRKDRPEGSLVGRFEQDRRCGGARARRAGARSASRRRMLVDPRQRRATTSPAARTTLRFTTSCASTRTASSGRCKRGKRRSSSVLAAGLALATYWWLEAAGGVDRRSATRFSRRRDDASGHVDLCAGTGRSNGSRRCGAGGAADRPTVAAPVAARDAVVVLRGPPPRCSSWLGILFLFFASAAAIHNGWLLLRWDLPIQRFVERHRTDDLTSFFLGASRLGSTVVVVAVSACLTVLTWRRCRAAGIAILVAASASAAPRIRPQARRRSRSTRSRTTRQRPGILVPERPRHGRGRPVRTRAARRRALHAEPRCCGGRPSPRRDS